MLRGFYPTDRRNPSEILYDSLERETDMWTHLANAIRRPQDTCTVLYAGKKHHRRYSDSLDVMFVNDIKDYKGPKPQFIFARGGFDEWYDFVNIHSSALRVYYGAGKRLVPSRGRWNMVFVDGPHQRDLVKEEKPYQNTQLFWKPAPPHFKHIPGIKQQYDVCYVAVHPKDKRKRLHWVYDTCPKDLKILQLGEDPGHHPKNVTHMNLTREEMPLAINACRIGIAPYTSDDSGPRIVPEMNACGLRVVLSETVPIWDVMYNTTRSSDEEFWGVVRAGVTYGGKINWTGSIALAGEHIRNTICSLWEDE